MLLIGNRLHLFCNGVLRTFSGCKQIQLPSSLLGCQLQHGGSFKAAPAGTSAGWTLRYCSDAISSAWVGITAHSFKLAVSRVYCRNAGLLLRSKRKKC